jgi:eukaryotic-like serine/threonine-protein kinase
LGNELSFILFACIVLYKAGYYGSSRIALEFCMVDLEGRTLDDFSLRRLVGRGGMADVYVAESMRTGREVAVKVFKREDEEMLRRFIREARLMASLHHSHLMPVYDTGVAQVDGVNRYYIVMPYIDGGTLRGRIHKSPLPLHEICRYIRDIASALDYIHSQGIIHRDIKSSNVLLSQDGYCYLSDFGVARTVSDATQMTSTGNVLGTVDYVAPELFEPDYKADARSDFYSLGVLLYEMVTGRLPFIGENQLAIVTMHVSKRPPLPSSFVPGLPYAVEQVVLRALAKDPAQRYPTARALAEAFCQATNAPREVGAARVVQETDASEQRGQLVLPAPKNTMRPATLDEATVGFHQPAGVGWMAPVEPRLPASQKRKASAAQIWMRVVTALGLLVLLAVLIPVIVVAYLHPQRGSTSSTSGTPQKGSSQTTVAPTQVPTATPNQAATAQAGFQIATVQAAHATATVVVGMTATAQAQVSATAGVVQTATAQTAAYNDPLTNANNTETINAGWDSDTSNCVFNADGYHVITDLLSNLKGCHEQNVPFSNGTISVNMVLISGTYGGVFFRLSTTNIAKAYYGYLFEIDAQGNYQLLRSDDYSLESVVTLKKDKVSSGWKAGYLAKNALEMIVSGSAISLYANDSYLATISDATYTSGTIGFAVTKGSDNQQGEAVFSELKKYP